MDGSSRWTSLEQGTWASGLYADASSQAGSSPAAAAPYRSVQPGDKQVSANSVTASAAASTPADCHPVLHTASTLQQGRQMVSEQAAVPVDMNRSTGTLQLSFHKGLYHDVITQPNIGIQSADMVFGANAGALVFLTDMALQVCLMLLLCHNICIVPTTFQSCAAYLPHWQTMTTQYQSLFLMLCLHDLC